VAWLDRLRLQHLRLLVDLAESGSLTRAAKSSHTTQPGLSKWLKELEKDAGTALFERYPRGLLPTAQGRLLLGHARRILNAAARAERDLESMNDGYALTMVIGVSPAAAPTLLPAAILAFLQRYPLAHLEVREGTMDLLLQRLDRGELDLVVGRTDNFPLTCELRYEVLYNEPICLVARPEHPLTLRRKLDWPDVYAYDWIVWPRGSPIRSKLDAALTLAGMERPPYRIESASQMTNLCLLQDTDMISVASLHVAKRFAASGLLKILAIPLDGSGAIGMCWRDEALAESATPEFLPFLRLAASRV